ncbi:hypothetical protein ES703_101968 [subsurface metagenome]
MIDGGIHANFNTQASRRIGNGLADATGASGLAPPRRIRTVQLAHIVMEQHVGGPRGLGAQHGANDANQAVHGPDNIGFDVLADEIVSAHGHHFVEMVKVVLTQAVEVLTEIFQGLQIAKAQLVEVGGRVFQDRFYRQRHLVHDFAKDRHDIRITLGMALDLFSKSRGVRIADEAVAVVHRQEGVIDGLELQAVFGKFEFPRDFGAQQADHVGTDRVGKSRVDLIGNRCTTQNVPSLQHQNLAPRLGEVGRTRQAVVSAADNDCIILLTHFDAPTIDFFCGGS